MKYLTQNQVADALIELDVLGYPSYALINLLQSLGVDSDKFNFSTDGETSLMPVKLYEAVRNYAEVAHQVKTGWKDGLNPYDILPLLPDRANGKVTLKMAKDALKVVVRGNIANIVATLEKEAVSATDVEDSDPRPAEVTLPAGGNYHIYDSRFICECGAALSVFASKNPFDGRDSYTLCFTCGAVHKISINTSGGAKG